MTISLAGQEWIVEHGFNLYIDTTTACNAHCKFCIAPSIGRRNGNGYFDGLRFALDLTEKIHGTVQVVGGEPLISKRLPQILSEIGRRKYHRAVINTNGSYLAPPILNLMKQGKITHINISRHHYQDDKNQEIMAMKPFSRNADLLMAIHLIQSFGIPIRLNANLIKNYIDDFDSMRIYIDWAADQNIKEVSFSQIFPLDLFDYQVEVVPGFTSSVQVDLAKIVSDIEQSSDFLSVLPNTIFDGSVWGSGWGGRSKRRFWYTPRGGRMSLKTLSGYNSIGFPNQTDYHKETDPELFDGILSFAVVHPDGLVTASWDTRERVIFNPAKTIELISYKEMELETV